MLALAAAYLVLGPIALPFTLYLWGWALGAAVLVAGYFTPAAARLIAGDLIIVQASDSVSVIPVRISAQVAAGVVIDTTAAPFRVDRQAAQRFSVMQAASALVQTIVLAPLAAGLVGEGVVAADARQARRIWRLREDLSVGVSRRSSWRRCEYA